MVSDALGLSACWLGAYGLRGLLADVALMGPINDLAPYLKVYPLIVLAGVANCATFGLYIHRRRLSSLNRPLVLLQASYHWVLYIVAIGFFMKELDLGRSVILFAAIFGLFYLFASRSLLRGLKRRSLSRGNGTVRCCIVGLNPLGIEARSAIRTHPEIGFTLVGMVRHQSDPQLLEGAGDVRLLGTTDELETILTREQIEELFLATAHLQPSDQLSLLNTAQQRGISVHVISDLFDVITERAKVDEIGTFPVITLRDGHLPLHQRVLKAVLDYTAASVGVILWLLLFHWWIAWRIRRDSPGPIFFTQERVGLDGSRFRIYKYRTMRTDAQPYAVAPTEEDDPRVTRFGRWLRKTSLDELPQLLNVLRGEMSMVGPRPEMPFIVEQYAPWERRRLDVKPGVTGLWQVIGRKNLPLHLNMQYDLYYIRNQSFFLDLEVLLLTIPAVLKGRGAF